MGLRTKVNIPKGSNGKALKRFRKTQKNVSKRIRSTEGIGQSLRVSRQPRARDVGDELAGLSGIDSAKRSKRPKDDPFSQIGL